MLAKEVIGETPAVFFRTIVDVAPSLQVAIAVVKRGAESGFPPDSGSMVRVISLTASADEAARTLAYLVEIGGTVTTAVVDSLVRKDTTLSPQEVFETYRHYECHPAKGAYANAISRSQDLAERLQLTERMVEAGFGLSEDVCAQIAQLVFDAELACCNSERISGHPISQRWPSRSPRRWRWRIS